MKKLIAISVAALALTGCSTTFVQKNVDDGKYADAYNMVYDAKPNSKLFEQRQKTTANIRDKTGGDNGDLFTNSLRNFITGSNWNPTVAEDFLQVKHLFDSALADK